MVAYALASKPQITEMHYFSVLLKGFGHNQPYLEVATKILGIEEKNVPSAYDLTTTQANDIIMRMKVLAWRPFPAFTLGGFK